MKNLFAAFVALAAGMAAVPAQSADNGIFLGGSVGAAGVKADDSFDGSNFDYHAGSTGYKLIAGWRFLDWLARGASSRRQLMDHGPCGMR